MEEFLCVKRTFISQHPVSYTHLDVYKRQYNKYVVVLTTLFSNSDLIYLISYIGIRVGENDG